MRTYDLPLLWRSSVGFERIFDLLNSSQHDDQSEWPPYDITRGGDDSYRITLALAGYSPNDISITAQQNLLIIAGQKSESPSHGALHQGIVSRPFEHRFSLEDHVEVAGAVFENGLLHVDLARRVPEAMKPRKIAIASGSREAGAKRVERARSA
jgi:molecular chaperone IbpA